MFSSPPVPKDLNLPFPSSPFKEEADLLHHQLRSGLVRYRSAPGSLLADLNEAETMFARFMTPTPDLREKQTAPNVSQPPLSMFQLHHLQQQVPNPSLGSMGVDQTQDNVKHGVSSGLIRQSSSSPGLLNHLGVDIGLRDGGGGRIKGQLSFPLRQSSLLSRISEDGDDGMEGGAADKGIAGRSPLRRFPVTSWEGGGALPEGFSGGKRSREPSEAQNGDTGNEIPSLAHNLSFLKRVTDTENMERFLQFQDVVPCKARAKRGCATHPRSIAERVRRTRISERMRKLQELVPNMDNVFFYHCICSPQTQLLCIPNLIPSFQQTNTADMLDLAVEYIKDLQRQAKVLSDSRKRCICSNNMHV